MAQLIVDVSEHNGDIDWAQVKDAGYHAIIRVGFGRHDSGGRVDNKFERNVTECERLGIPYGYYWYSYAQSPESASVEARDMLDAISGHAKPAYPIYFDTEENGTQSVSKANAEAFGDVIEGAGYWCGVYASQSWWHENLDGEERFTKWVAKWSDEEPDVADTDLWQNRGADADDHDLRGSVPGIGWSDVSVLLREGMLEEIGNWGSGDDAGNDSGASDDGGSEKDPDHVTGRLGFCERAAQVMEHLCRHDGDDGHGYSQLSRWGDGTYEVVTLSDGSTVQIANGDRDCSSAVIDAWEAALPGSTADATYTGNMREEFISTGLWRWHQRGDGYVAKRGDIYLNEAYHTAMCTCADPDTLAQFSISETGGVDGKEGDQTGWESNIRSFYEYPWDGTLEAIADGGDEPQDPGSGDGGHDDSGDDGMPDADTYASWISDIQREVTDSLSRYGQPGCDVDGEYGPETKSAVVRLLQCGLNADWGAGLDVDGILGSATLAAIGEHPVGVGYSDHGDDVYSVKCGLVINGWDVDLTNWDWDDACDAACRGHQQWHGLETDGIVGADTFATLLP